MALDVIKRHMWRNEIQKYGLEKNWRWKNIRQYGKIAVKKTRYKCEDMACKHKPVRNWERNNKKHKWLLRLQK